MEDYNETIDCDMGYSEAADEEFIYTPYVSLLFDSRTHCTDYTFV